ncbi:MAG: Ig-like domain-containing protein [Pseudomonadota bacterium]
MKTKTLMSLILILALLSAMLIACGPPVEGETTGDETTTGDGESGNEESDTGPSSIPTKITIVASFPTINIGGATSTITAIVTDENNAVVENATVIFATTLGFISPGSDTTGKDGVVSTTLTSGDTTGTATVTATTGGVTATVTVVFAASAGHLSVSAFPTTINAGGSTSTITAIVTDENNAVVEGATVLFGTNLGRISPRSDVTDEDGVVLATLTSSANSIGTATVTATTTNGLQASVTVTIVEAVTEDTTPAPAHIIISASPTTIEAGGASSTITITALNSANSVLPGVVVSLTTDLGILSASSVTTEDETGSATVTLTSRDITGTATVTARTTNGLQENAQITIITTPSEEVETIPSSIKLEDVDPTQIYIQGSGNTETAIITFSVQDAVGNPVTGEAVQFVLQTDRDGGERLVPSSAFTDVNGMATTRLQAGTKAKAVQVIAYCNESLYAITPAITICSGPPEGLHLSLTRTHGNIIGLLEDGITDTATLNLADLYSNPVPDNTAVEFQIEYAKIQEGSVSGGDGAVSREIITQFPRPTGGDPVHFWAETNSGAYAHITALWVSGDTIYAGTDGGGVFRTKDAGKSWDNIGRPRGYAEGGGGLWGTYINDITVNTGSGLYDLMVATEDGGVLYSSTEGSLWTDFGSMSDRQIDYISYPTQSALTYYPINWRSRISVVNAAGASPIDWRINGNVFQSLTAGNYTIEYDIDYGMPSSPPTCTAKKIRRYNDSCYYAIFKGNGLYRYTKTGKHWDAFNTGLPSTDISTVAIVGNSIYVTVSPEEQVYSSVCRETDPPAFTVMGSPLPLSFNDTYVLGTDIYYATTNQIRRLSTTSNTWTVISDTNATIDYPDNITRVLAMDANTIFAATNEGLYRFENNAGSWDVYPLNVCKEISILSADISSITLSYPSDKNMANTKIIVDNEEIPTTGYSFSNNVTISLNTAIQAGSTVEVSYTLKAYESALYGSAPQEKGYALYYDNQKLYFGADNRKVFCLENPTEASKNNILPKLRDISGSTTRISPVVYRTQEEMFSGSTRITLLHDSDGNGYYDNGPVAIANGGACVNFLAIVCDQNGRPVVGESAVTISTSVGEVNGAIEYTYDECQLYWPTQFSFQLCDDDPATVNDTPAGEVTVSVTAENGDEDTSINVSVQ